MPVVFRASPVIALRRLSTDPTDDKLHCPVLVTQKTALTVTAQPCLYGKLAEEHKDGRRSDGFKLKEEDSGWMCG